MSVSKLLLLLAVVLFVLTSLGVDADHVNLVRLGLASFAASFLT